MPHLASKDLPPKIRSLIEAQLWRLLEKHHLRGLLKELLTETEQLMLAKRLAALLMLEEELSYYRIQKTLELSTSTIKRLHAYLLSGECSAIEAIIRNKKEREKNWELMGTALRAGLPARGSNQWKRIDRILARGK